jgi:uncharacterized membrane protein YdbT with pleckstrin-like domain
MEENPIDHPGVTQEVYQKLGGKTLMIFILQRIQAAFVLLLVSIGLFIIQAQSFVAQVPVPNFPQYVGYTAWACLALFVIFFLISFLIAWLIYTNYKFCLGENSLKVKRGILNKEEVAIPYRQIQDVDIDRDISFQLMGLSRIIILTAGHEDTPQTGQSGESEGVLPALDKDLAEWLQAQLLQRANIQKVVEENPNSPGK